MSHCCNLFAIIIFIPINRIIWLIQTRFFGHVCQKFSLRLLFSFCLLFASFSLPLLIKALLIKKACRKKLLIKRTIKILFKKFDIHVSNFIKINNYTEFLIFCIENLNYIGKIQKSNVKSNYLEPQSSSIEKHVFL